MENRPSLKEFINGLMEEKYSKKFEKEVEPEEELKVLTLECKVGSTVGLLADGINCTLEEVPLVNKVMILNRYLLVKRVGVKVGMKSILDLELEVVYSNGETNVVYNVTYRELYRAGLGIIIDNEDEVVLTPMEFRGLNLPVNVAELEAIITEQNK